MIVKIRTATIIDLPTLLEFEQDIITYESDFDPTFKQEPFIYYELEPLILGEESEVMVAEIDGKIVGSGHVRIKNSEPFNKFDKYAFLGFMYVHPEFRGQGINQKITAELIKWANDRDLNEIRLKVYSENDSAIKAYEKSGFKPFLTEMRFSPPTK
ncbi:Ribosomal protein S18 acetylase RimI [Spirosomataceae bacterium TFI 002]|nr:Ribosomal protein S18 acetylase RimI [Spirosomataceae bacterium TFI 002]